MGLVGVAWENIDYLCGRGSALAAVSVNQSDDQVSFISCLLCPLSVLSQCSKLGEDYQELTQCCH